MSRPATEASATLSRVSTVEALERAIRAEVLNGDIRAGSQLREMDLVTRYDVGRNSVRAALQALVHTGLLRHEQNRGVFVPRLSIADVEDLYRVRTAIETEAVRLIVRTGADLSAAEAAVEALIRLTEDAGWMTAVELDLQVHRAIVEATESPRMIRTFEGFVSEQKLLLAQLKRHYPQPAALGPLHREIVDALRRGDEIEAVHVMRQHLKASPEEIARAISRDVVD